MSDRYRLDLTRRPRRMRRNSALRALANETTLAPGNLIQPLFVIDGDGAPEPIDSMPGQQRLCITDLVAECRDLLALGIPAVALFPKLDAAVKSDDGREALNPDTLVLRAIRALKAEVPDIAVITDLALDPYTTHGHDGLLDMQTGDLANDATVEILAEMAVLAAEAGVDLVAPSDMMDGRVGAIREALDGNGHERTGIMAYSAKFASAFYGPFRDAVGSASSAGTHHLDKRTYQLNPGNRREALIEVNLDEEEGADILMVKPAGPYLDIIREVREETDLPLAAYQVSGEYAQIMAAAQQGWLDLERCRDESLLAIRRAGADMILTYFAKDFARGL
ncbi:porphobilinogen synthase [Coraliomargarita akajimensis]|uniref:Delta-aminolevulinic acid dehydratase n=1 Tax=Coraliomargarita akajimensis (strain DSM 45221 / IAM 15411 / JCM 23193 / KCTC 12865 / 04OKA010-24) TaxID=583355 RepID=D5EJG0_CORAD|nr:porphobilinogen synthase [Coraliomargarita akajimensis]ADE54559.1 Porphobilinogen synthase [Coraliomargarita akajimensis DSM 45221]